MSRNSILLIIVSFALALSSCKTQEQIRAYNEIISPAANGNVDLTLLKMDSVRTFSNPLVNLKYQKIKKKYKARFTSNNEKSKASCKNEVINNICRIYQDYWKLKLLNTPVNSDSILYNSLSHYLVENHLTEISFDVLVKTIHDDIELTKVIENEGFYCKFFLINGIQDILIWNKQSHSTYVVELPEDTIDVNVIFIDNYVLRGASSYATFGFSQIGGWSSIENSSLFCNKGTYSLKSEKFQYSYLKHESIHFIDTKEYPYLEPADLEYRAKLVELIYCTDKTIYKRLDEFILGSSNETRDNSHPFANYHLINQLSKKFFNSEFESDILKWKTIPSKEINEVSLELFRKGSDLLEKTPSLARIIENI